MYAIRSYYEARGPADLFGADPGFQQGLYQTAFPYRGIALAQGLAGFGRGKQQLLAHLALAQQSLPDQFLQAVIHHMGVFDVQHKADIRQFLGSYNFV